MIVLINPPFSDKNTYYYSFISEKYANPSLAYLAGYLEKKNIDFKVIDAKFEDLNMDQVLDRMKGLSPKIIGFTSNTTEIDYVHTLVSKTRMSFPDAFIILGGVHATALPMETFENSKDLDALVVGEGEFVLEALSCTKNIRNEISEIPGLYYRLDGKIVSNPTKQYPPDMRDYGKAALHLWSKAERYFVTTYRGCPFPCSFCFRALGKNARLRDPEDVIAELEYIAENAPNSELWIIDATFGLDQAYSEKILNEIISRKLNEKLKWRCTTRVDTVDEKFLQLMKQAGCVAVSFGVESGSDRILKATGKQITVDACIKTANMTKRVGIKAVGYYIFGHIGETKDELNETLELIWKMNCDYVAIGVMVPWPGTEVYNLAKKNQGGYKLISNDYSGYDKYFGSVMEFDNFSMNYLDLMRIKAFFYLYLKNYRFIDLASFFWACRAPAYRKIKQLVFSS